LCNGGAPAYLGDSSLSVGGQSVTGAAQAVVQQATGRRRQLGQQQHVIMTVSLRKMRQAVALPVSLAQEPQRLTARL
ncbi:uncharacterized, partial [Tachysurus ichikawai]